MGTCREFGDELHMRDVFATRFARGNAECVTVALSNEAVVARDEPLQRIPARTVNRRDRGVAQPG